jgi:hypothetical protein
VITTQITHEEDPAGPHGGRRLRRGRRHARRGGHDEHLSPSPRAPQTQLTGDTADKVKAAAEAKVPGGTVLRVEGGGPDGSAYHAYVRRSDGSEVVVLVNASFEATSVAEPPHR